MAAARKMPASEMICIFNSLTQGTAVNFEIGIKAFKRYLTEQVKTMTNFPTHLPPHRSLTMFRWLCDSIFNGKKGKR